MHALVGRFFLQDTGVSQLLQVLAGVLSYLPMFTVSLHAQNSRDHVILCRAVALAFVAIKFFEINRAGYFAMKPGGLGLLDSY